ncbi:bifunctional chorismate-binding protein/class IV aminotransferase [Leptospira idonii]|uniref:Bifunctional aminodeoxychorismate synthase component I/aminotransferase n=1 Tax=Leptospira idonii TaxID=1193500 RepID=A0A4R9LWE4_9LEPT|nr:bifunctional anthranilate synthase component I family protein/class IV aminotransferase [Leptospira idonii]TGN17664.1 bifunctional aminodeoxychorismate synthase component I/aminotransferase [Leptospira idonii]
MFRHSNEQTCYFRLPQLSDRCAATDGVLTTKEILSWNAFYEEYSLTKGVLFEDNVSAPGITTADWYHTLQEEFTVFSENSQPETTLQKLKQTLDDLEARAKSGSFIICAMNYEAGFLFEPKLHQVAKQFTNEIRLLQAFVFQSKKKIRYQTPNLNELGVSEIESILPENAKQIYTDQVKRGQSFLKEGESYELNLSFETKVKAKGNPFFIYQKLKRKQKTKYSAYLPLNRSVILSLSPELFWNLEDKNITTEPMKGTSLRGISYQEDLIARKDLETSEKERAENVMITDLFRNDLGKISEIGSVEVPSLFQTVPLDSVWQMVSVVKSKLNGNISFSNLVSQLFPSGSITGAPKIRSQELIREIENRERGIYTGSIFNLEFEKGKMHSTANVAIRTLELKGEEGTLEGNYSVGSGITVLSDPEKEYNECLSKLHFLSSEDKPDFEILETLRFFDGRYRLKSLHLKRMKESAFRFGYPFSEQKANEALESISQVASGLLRIRLLLNRKGDFRAESFAFTRTGKSRTVTLSWSKNKLNPNDLFLYHKTTVRNFYQEELEKAQEEGCEDSILIQENGDVSETCIRNLFYQKEGIWFTPDLHSGGLPGTFREYLIQKSWVKERKTAPKDILEADLVLVGNSLRGLERVSLRESIS